MRTTTLKRIGAVSAVLAFTGAAPAVAAAPDPVTTVFDLNGTYSGPESTLPKITRIGDKLTVDMSALGRPTASGTVVDGETISVTFPDDANYVGTLALPGTIKWSNRSTWYKTRPVPNVTRASVASAIVKLSYSGFARGAITPAVNNSCLHTAVVVEQNPRAGAPAIPGSRVDLTVQKPPGKRCR
jgi:hypothetical protein